MDANARTGLDIRAARANKRSILQLQASKLFFGKSIILIPSLSQLRVSVYW